MSSDFTFWAGTGANSGNLTVGSSCLINFKFTPNKTMYIRGFSATNFHVSNALHFIPAIWTTAYNTSPIATGNEVAITTGATGNAMFSTPVLIHANQDYWIGGIMDYGNIGVTNGQTYSFPKTYQDGTGSYVWSFIADSCRYRYGMAYSAANLNWANGSGPYDNQKVLPYFEILASKALGIKHLVKTSDQSIKIYSGSAWSEVGTDTPTMTLFENSGMDDTALATAITHLSDLTSPKILSAATLDPTMARLRVTETGVPLPRIITPKGDIAFNFAESIKSVTLTSTQTGSGVVRVAVSNNAGTNWYTWKDNAWTAIDITNANAFKTDGMTKEVLNAITETSWNTLFMTDKIARFSYYLEVTNGTDVASTDKIATVLDLNGTWRAASQGEDFDYEYDFPDATTIQVKLYQNGSYKINYPSSSSSPDDLQAQIDTLESSIDTLETNMANYVAKSGSTMTGPLVLSGNPTQALHASPKQYLESFLTSGWISLSDACSYNSADDPIYSIIFTGVNLTSRIQPRTRMKFDQVTGGTKFAIVHKSELVGSDTVVTIYMGTDYDLVNESITNVYYSPIMSPYGFPVDPDKWSYVLTNSNQLYVTGASNPVYAANTWLNINQFSFSVPIGCWAFLLEGIKNINTVASLPTLCVTVSTGNNTESNSALTNWDIMATGQYQSFVCRGIIKATTKTTHYLNVRSNAATISSILLQGEVKPVTITLYDTYL